MKKIVKSLIVLSLIIVISPVMAKEYTISTTDIKVNLDDQNWYVFTRDNLDNNKQLEELGINSSTLNQLFINGNIYLDALKILDNNDYVELFVMKKPVEKIKNMSKYSDRDLKAVAEEIAKKENTSDYKVYKTKYKYVYTKYTDSGKTIIDYYTVINGAGYTIKTQKSTDFTATEEKEIENIIKNISFNINESLKESSKGLNPIIKDMLIGAAIGGLSGAIYGVANKSKKKKKVNE